MGVPSADAVTGSHFLAREAPQSSPVIRHSILQLKTESKASSLNMKWTQECIHSFHTVKLIHATVMNIGNSSVQC